MAAGGVQHSAIGAGSDKATFDTRIALLEALNTPAEKIKSAATDRDNTLGRFRTADANISDFMIEKERVENYLQYVVVALFALGSLLAGFGRAMEMRARPD